MDDYLSKPIDLALLHQAIHHWTKSEPGKPSVAPEFSETT